ncbi:flagellar hook-length control protein FliK [Lachnospira pectinoschiza]|uniref:Hook-length control protein FliK n=1 Tax=Lachnospira pectinoschiza TaxID=28052 RepID=A0A1G9Z876_9FIRM|nr:flagellar hook-length control protein FliK [Lachnospira pectinoschiza]SDN17534.1 hook-length control protein FliK [Lachnospira pectinoschiza]
MQLANLETSLKLNFNMGPNSTSKKLSGPETNPFGQVLKNTLKTSNSTSKETNESFASTQTKQVKTNDNNTNKADFDNEIKTSNNELESSVNKLEEVDESTSIPTDLINEEAKEIISEIADLLDIDSDEIIETMASLNMNVFDLFDLSKIQELMLELNGEGEIALIVDGDFSSKLEDILAFVKDKIEDLAESFDIPVEELRKNFEGEKNIFEGIFLKEDNKELVDTSKLNAQSQLISPKQAFNEASLEEPKEDSLESVIEEKTIINLEKNPAQANENASSNEKGQDIFNNKKEDLNTATVNNQTVTSDVYKNFANALESIENTTINQVDVARQVIDQIKLTSSQNLNQIEVMLNPENLGSVHVTVTAKEGIITAELTATNEAVKKALENQMQTLKENFNNQGIKVEAVSVTIESHSFEGNTSFEGDTSKDNLGQDKKKRMNLDLSSLNDLDFEELTADEIRARDLIENGDASVSYLA